MRNQPMFLAAKKALHATELAVPYNNVSNLFVRNGEVPNPRFGGDCLYQAHLFAERLRAAVDGVAVRFHNQEGKGTAGHVIPIVGDGDDRAAVEITALAAEPIMLAEVRGRGNQRLIPTFPCAPLGNRQLSCFWIEQVDQLHIGLRINGEGGLLEHRIATDSPIPMPESWHPTDAFMCAQPRRPMKLHALDRDYHKSTVTMDAVDGSMTAQHVGAPPTHRGTKAFESEFSRIAGTLGVAHAQLMEFFQEGWRMERELQGL